MGLCGEPPSDDTRFIFSNGFRRKGKRKHSACDECGVGGKAAAVAAMLPAAVSVSRAVSLVLAAQG